MSNVVAIEDGEVRVAVFRGDEGFAEVFSGFFEVVGIFGADVELLDLEGVVDFI